MGLTMNNIQTIENEIRSKLPHTMELSAGCEIYTPHWDIFKQQFDKDVFDRFYIFNGSIFDDNNQYFTTAEDIEKDFDFKDCIIGHPITLPNVLEWLMKNENEAIYSINVYGTFLDCEMNAVAEWDFRKNLLREQSSELIESLFNLIER